MANIRPKSVIILIGAVRPGPKYGRARKKTAGYHLFRNVLPECNSIPESQLTAAAMQLFSRDVRKRPAYVLCFSTCTIALRATHRLCASPFMPASLVGEGFPHSGAVSFSANGLVVMASLASGSLTAVLAAVADPVT